jgi:hypothetical protein
LVFFRAAKRKLVWEALNPSSLSNREGAVFVWVQKQMRVSKAGVDRAGNVVPAKPAAFAIEGVHEVDVIANAPKVSFPDEGDYEGF